MKQKTVHKFTKPSVLSCLSVQIFRSSLLCFFWEGGRRGPRTLPLSPTPGLSLPHSLSAKPPGEFAASHPCLEVCSCSRSTVRIGTRWDTRAALAHSSSAHQKTHSSDAAIRKQCEFDREVQSWAKFKRVGSRLAKSRFEKHLHTRIVASHVVNRARDACCPQSLT